MVTRPGVRPLVHGVIPDFKDLQRAGDGAQLRMPEPTGAPANKISAGLLYRVVVRQHMQPFAAGLRVKLAATLLAGNIASALVGASRALLAARPDLRGPIVEITSSLLDTGVLSGSGVITGSHLGFRRGSCCLFYRIPGRSVCGDCVFRRTPHSNRR